MPVSAYRFSLYRRSNRIYYIGYYQEGHRRWKSTGVTTRTEALTVLTEFRSLFQNRQRRANYSQFCEEFLSYAVMQNASRTVALFRQVLRGFGSVVKNMPLRDLTSQHIELRMLKSAFNTALRWKLISENPCKGVPFAHVPEQAPIFITPGDFERLIRTISETWLKELVVFAVLTGLRRAEIVNLRWVDVEMERGVILIQSSPRFKTKQGKRRTIPLNSTALELLRKKKEHQGGEYVFTLNGGRISGDWVSHLFKRYVRNAELADDRIHFHSIRHSFASWLVQGGATLYEVQKLLGHSSSKVTEIYSHLQPEQMHATVNKIVISMN
jgi:integrase